MFSLCKYNKKNLIRKIFAENLQKIFELAKLWREKKKTERNFSGRMMKIKHPETHNADQA